MTSSSPISFWDCIAAIRIASMPDLPPLSDSQGTSCGRTARKITHKASSGYPAEQSAVEAESRPYAERFPPYEPVSLKNDKGLGKLKKKSDQDREPHRESVCVRTRGGTEKFRIRVSGRVEV